MTMVDITDSQGHMQLSDIYISGVGMKRDISCHCKTCQICAKHNIAKVKFEKTHFKGARQPMQFISMDLIGEFHPLLNKDTGML